jgi:hypothetical protein
MEELNVPLQYRRLLSTTAAASCYRKANLLVLSLPVAGAATRQVFFVWVAVGDAEASSSPQLGENK